MTDSSSKLIQQPEIRASDGQKASLKIGERVPVATGSFQPGIGGVGINPLVNTQFNYIDVGVNIDITPHVHGLDDVTLKLAMDISAVDSYQNIGGIMQPVIGQRKMEAEIRMKEGEVNIIGGIMEETTTTWSIGNSRAGFDSAVQVSVLARKQRSQRQRDRLYPDSAHRARAGCQCVSNMKAIDVGTANSIVLRKDNAQPNNGNGQPQGGNSNVPGNGPGAMNNSIPPRPSMPQPGMTPGACDPADRGFGADGQPHHQLRSAHPRSGGRFHLHCERESGGRPECFVSAAADHL